MKWQERCTYHPTNIRRRFSENRPSNIICTQMFSDISCRLDWQRCLTPIIFVISSYLYALRVAGNQPRFELYLFVLECVTAFNKLHIFLMTNNITNYVIWIVNNGDRSDRGLFRSTIQHLLEWTEENHYENISQDRRYSSQVSKSGTSRM
jgi:hypothetical protein